MPVPKISPEARFITLCVREPDAAPPEQIRVAARAVRRWQAVVDTAARHRVTGFVSQATARVPEAVPDWARDALHHTALAGLARVMLLDRALGDLLERLAAARIPVIVLKGPVLARTIYDSSILRPYADIDLTVQGRHEAGAAAVLATRARPVVTIIGPGVYSLLLVCVQALLMVAIGRLAMGAKLQFAHLGLVAVAIAITIASLTGIGLMSAAFVVAFKQPEPATTRLMAASLMISGILYPTMVLPAWLARLALLLERAAVGSLAVRFVVLGLYSLSLPAGLLLLSAAITQAKRAGSLAHY